jgi:hypothetical protein
MRPTSRFPLFLILLGLLVFTIGGRALAAVTVQSRIDPPEASVGDEVTVTFTIQGGSVSDIQLPPVDGLAVQGSSTSSQFVMNGFQVSQSVAESFSIVPTRAGDFTIPSFGIHAENGQVIHTQPLKLHVLAGSAPPAPPTPAAPPTPGNGPVVMPPADQNQNPPQNADTDAGRRMLSVPTDADGQTARVFDLITPRTIEAYVGESVPLTIQSYIRADSNAQQNSLPTLIGSDFLMNNLSLRPAQDGVGLGNAEYIRDTWVTAISAPRAGDFPLQATRDTYYTQGAMSSNDPFGGLFGRSAQLMHKEILSNKFVIHVHPLPDQDRPTNFTGAIGHFQATGSAIPATVGVGEPVTLHFTVTGQGNFDYVRSPTLAADPAWRTYVPTSKVSYEDESHTQATKTFEQAVIPQKNGTLQIPPASFSYFDPDAKHYVSIPVPLPTVVVTGTIAPVTAAASSPADAADAVTTPVHPPDASTDFLPNRLTLGVLTPDLKPGYGHPAFWILQAALAALVLLGIVLKTVRRRPDPARAERSLRHASLREAEDAMGRAVHAGDASAFFAAARRSVQLQLAERWGVSADILTLHEIWRRDASLGETVAPLFHEADDVIYSGQASTDLDLAEWDRRVRGLLQPASL